MIRDQQLDVPNRIVSVSADQILTLPLGQRWMLFAQWMHSYNKLIQQDLRNTETEYKDKIVEYNQLKGQALAALCRTADIVGMTTTGAAKNRLMLESLKPIIGNKQLIKFTPIRFSLFAFVCSDRGGSGPRPGIACREFLDTRLPAVDYDRRSSTTAPTCECLPFGERLSSGRVAIRTLNSGRNQIRLAGCSTPNAARSGATYRPFHLSTTGEPQKRLRPPPHPWNAT